MLPSRAFRLPLALALAGAALVGWALVAHASGNPTVAVDMRYSKFQPDSIRLRAGQSVTFVITNRDPIDHEFILGNQAVQDRHETGTEPHHGLIPTEVSVPARTTVTTTVTFAEPADLVLGCHLPGHYAYGMKASVVVR